MVLEANTFFLFSASVLNVEDRSDKLSSYQSGRRRFGTKSQIEFQVVKRSMAGSTALVPPDWKNHIGITTGSLKTLKNAEENN